MPARARLQAGSFCVWFKNSSIRRCVEEIKCRFLATQHVVACKPLREGKGRGGNTVGVEYNLKGRLKPKRSGSEAGEADVYRLSTIDS